MRNERLELRTRLRDEERKVSKLEGELKLLQTKQEKTRLKVRGLQDQLLKSQETLDNEKKQNEKVRFHPIQNYYISILSSDTLDCSNDLDSFPF